ncbi:MAG: DUF4389 domain-containing protein [Candidatus Micrarchaeota archaeon]
MERNGDRIKTVRIDVHYQESADPIEIIYRLGWGIVFFIIFNVLQALLLAFAILQFLSIAIRRKRSPLLHRWTRAIYDNLCQNWAYIFGLTDERSPIIPDF